MNKKHIIAIAGGLLLIGIIVTIVIVATTKPKGTIVIDGSVLVGCAPPSPSPSPYHDPEPEPEVFFEEAYCDEAGNVVKKEVYAKDSSLLQLTELYEYDQDGNIIKSERYDFKDGFMDYKLHKYDRDGNRVRIEYYTADGNLTSYELYEYDQEGNLIKRVVDAGDEAYFSFYVLYKYNQDNLLVEEEVYRINDALTRRWFYKYDQEGNLIIKDGYKYNYNGGVQHYDLFKYDRDGNRVRVEVGLEKCADSTGYSGVGYIKYCDKDGNTIKQEIHKADQLEGYWLYEYDQAGNEVRAEWHDAEGNLEYYRLYEYDQEGLRLTGEHYDADGNFQYREDYEADRELITTPPRL